MSSTAAVSATVRDTTPSTERNDSPWSGPREIRPRCTLRPTSPQHAAGIRIDPPPAVAWAIGTRPPAAAAAEAPGDPPGVWSVFHGWRVGPKRRGSVTGTIPLSGAAVLPTITKPAFLSRRTRNA